MRRTAVLVSAVATMTVLFAGAALAEIISCPTGANGSCVGTGFDDTLTGTKKADNIKARGGGDTVNARGGNDRVCGGEGADYLVGGSGDDTLNGGFNLDTELEGLDGGAGDDALVESTGPDRYLFGADWGKDRITGDGDPQDGGFNNDDVCFVCVVSPGTAGVTIDLAAGRAFETAAGRRGPNSVTWTPGIIEFAVGGLGADTIRGSDRSNVVNGFSGADSINVSGDGGGDTVNCGGGDSATDAVTMDAGDAVQGNSCDGDTIVTVP